MDDLPRLATVTADMMVPPIYRFATTEKVTVSVIAVLCAVTLVLLWFARRNRSDPEGDGMPSLPRPVLMTHAAAHFAVDMASAYCFWQMFADAEPEHALCAAIAYNGFAFFLQYGFGRLADARSARFSRNGTRAAVLVAFLCVMLCASPLYKSLGDDHIPIIIITGLANACFHVFAGKEVLDKSGNRETAAGAFVCTGAAGLFAGTCAAKVGMALENVTSQYLTTAIVVGIPAICLAAECVLERPVETAPRRKEMSRRDVGICAMLLATVALRSLVGLKTPSSTTLTTTLPTLAGVVAVGGVVCGKFVGGLVAERVGRTRTALGSLALSGLLFALTGANDLMILPATFLFNFTMPITMCMMADHMPGSAGTAFGALSAALFAGYLLSLSVDVPEPVEPLALALFAGISLALMTWAFALETEDAGENAEVAA